MLYNVPINWDIELQVPISDSGKKSRNVDAGDVYVITAHHEHKSMKRIDLREYIPIKINSPSSHEVHELTQHR
ncbi:hypothetical protein BPOR_0069g00200 [Botrytis porri]|uniref:Uncharacterized protein n=1 Tax=Botrytis porri TaxID=87229 RepID=A0A4Z1L0J7_9HELO|nr:hypothetical protein BPOR_0069g00200 [Botrytis porri]